MNVLVTGGAGFVGSSCLRHILAAGEKAVVIDNLCQGHRAAVPDGLLVQADVSDTETVLRVMRDHEIDAVMHFAAATDVAESVRNPDYHYHNNIEVTRRLLVAMREANVRKIVFSSTGATYGLNPTVPLGEDGEKDPCCPYGRTKLAVEWMIRDFADAYGMGFTLLRYFNAAGAPDGGDHGEDHDPESHLIPVVLQVALGQREKVMVFGDDYDTEDGTCIRDYVHVNDLAQAHLLAIRTMTPESRGVYNVGTGRGNSVLEVIEACEKVVGQSILREIGPRRPGDPPVLVADPTRLKTELGWEPRHLVLEETVASAWKWHQAHPQGYDDKSS